MKSLILTISLLTLFTTQSARASFEWGFAHAETACNGTSVIITVDLNIFGEVPAHLVGWVVDRDVLGVCVDDVQVGDVRPIPSGQQQFVLTDRPGISGRMTLYRIAAVDADGNRTPIFWNQRTQFATANCVGGPVVRGTVIELLPNAFNIETCSGQCWPVLSMYDNQFPVEMPQLVGQVINLYGEFFAGMEGPYIYASGWTPALDGCGEPIPVEVLSWGAIKGSYR